MADSESSTQTRTSTVTTGEAVLKWGVREWGVIIVFCAGVFAAYYQTREEMRTQLGVLQERINSGLKNLADKFDLYATTNKELRDAVIDQIKLRADVQEDRIRILETRQSDVRERLKSLEDRNGNGNSNGARR